MRTTYDLMDGGRITADSPLEFLTELRKSSKFESEATDEVFMEHFAERLKTYNGSKIRTDSRENFFEDLKATGFIIQ